MEGLESIVLRNDFPYAVSVEGAFTKASAHFFEIEENNDQN